MEKIPYICGALTELPPEEQARVKHFYSQLADVCQETMGQRAFVPHELFDPIAHAKFSPNEVDMAERAQVCERTSLLVVVALQPTWGGGIEVEMANRSNVPAILLKPEWKKVSRLLLGNPAIKATLKFQNFDHALHVFRDIMAYRKTRTA